MPRRSREEEEEEEGRGGKRSRGVESFIDDAASEDEDADEEEEDYEGGGRGRSSKRRRSSLLIDDMAQVDDDGEEDVDDEIVPGFIDDTRIDTGDNDVGKRSIPHSSSMMDDEDDIQEFVRRLQNRYETSSHFDYDEEVTEVEQQAFLPSVKDPKLWMVKCVIGHERETAVCLMQKFIDRPDLQMKSVVALEHLKNYIYIEAEKEAHVKEACKGLRNIIASAKITLVPIREMADVLSVESKSVDVSRDSWVRMKLGVYKGDLAKVVDVDNVRQRVTVKLIPRIDLQALVNKLDGHEVVKKKSFIPPPRFFNVDEAREMHIRVDRRRNRDSGEYFDVVDGLMFKDGFLYKTFSIKSISTQNIQNSAYVVST